MTEAEIVKIFKTYYNLLERDFNYDRQLTVVAAAQLTNAHILQLFKYTIENTPNSSNVNVTSIPDSFMLQNIRDILSNIQLSLERISQNIDKNKFGF